MEEKYLHGDIIQRRNLWTALKSCGKLKPTKRILPIIKIALIWNNGLSTIINQEPINIFNKPVIMKKTQTMFCAKPNHIKDISKITKGKMQTCKSGSINLRGIINVHLNRRGDGDKSLAPYSI